jgi:peptide/nickel transport system substrate-binding protein
MDMFALLLQSRDPALRDPRFRRAIALSIDVSSLTRVVTQATGTPDSSPIPIVSPYSGPPQRVLIKRDLVQARALAQAAGYRGEPITLVTSHSPPESYDMAIVIQAMAREAGINFQILTLDWASQLTRYSSGDYQAMVFQYSARLDPSLTVNAFTGDRTVDPRKVWDSPRALALLKASIEAESKPDRQRAFDALDAAFREEAPAVIAFNSGRITGLRDGVTGYRSWPSAMQRLWNVAPPGKDR